MNSETLEPSRDVGKDGKSGHSHETFARDEYGYSLSYYDDDYKPVDAQHANMQMSREGTDIETTRGDLYNGNISQMTTAVRSFMQGGTGNAGPQSMNYTYDQLNRLKSATAYQSTSGDAAGNSWSNGRETQDYHVELTYDKNGNITSLHRNGAQEEDQPQQMDQLTYHYEDTESHTRRTNRLLYVEDAVNADNYSTDIDDQTSYNTDATYNYAYDAIGNLTQVETSVEDPDTRVGKLSNTSFMIEDLVIGKVRAVHKNAGADLCFGYGAGGNRIKKEVRYPDATEDIIVKTYYIRDAQGNVMGMYQATTDQQSESSFTEELKLAEHNLYGSERMGQTKYENEVLSEVAIEGMLQEDGSIAVTTTSAALVTPEPITHELGLKRYEGKNHLGNVLVVFSDRKEAIEGDGGMVASYNAHIMSATDYGPFGMIQPGRSISADKARYGFNGMEKDDEVKGSGNHYDYGDRNYDPRLGRWWSLDPLKNIYTGVSPYVFAGNSPTLLSDPDGNILRDKDGNIIVTSTGTYTALNYSPASARVTNPDGTSSQQFIARNYEVATIYADDGTPVEALRLVEAHVITANFDSKGNLTSTTGKKAVDDSKFDATADCHGYTFASNNLWINNDQVDKILGHDDYTRDVGEKEAEVVIFKDKGDVIHSGRRNIDGTYTNNAGYSTTESGVTLEGAARGLTDVSVPGNVEFAKKNTPDRQVDISSGTVSGGLRTVTKDAVTKALEKTSSGSGGATGSTETGGTTLPALDLQPYVTPANATYVDPPVISPIPEKR